MIYEIIKQDEAQTTWILENPPFVRLAEDNTYSLTNESNAHGVYIEGIVYHILGRAPIQGLEDVTVGITSETVYSNVQVKTKLDAQDTVNSTVSNDLDDLWVAVLEG